MSYNSTQLEIKEEQTFLCFGSISLTLFLTVSVSNSGRAHIFSNTEAAREFLFSSLPNIKKKKRHILLKQQ